MKLQKIKVSHIATIILLIFLLVPKTNAAPLYWDTNGDATDATYGGSGTWDTTNTFWNTSPTIGSGTLQAWNNAAAPYDTAQFLRGTTGTVTVSGLVEVLSITFGSSTGSFTTGSANYTLSGGTINLRTASFGNSINNGASSSSATTVVNSAVTLFDNLTLTTTTDRQRFVNNGGSLTLGSIEDISGLSGTGNHQLSLESYSGAATTISGNIIKSTGSKGIELIVGGAGTSGASTYTLEGNNTGLAGVVSLNRGSLVLNSSNALVGAASLTVENANTTVALADTANVLIGTAGVTINKAITFSALTATDTSDIRTIGGSNTTGTSTFSGTVTLGAFAPSGNGSSLRVTAATGGTTVFSNNITDGANTVAITKTGDGIVKFTRATGLSYDGGTTVSAGTLLINNNTSGSGTGTGAVTVATGATLGGTGTVSGAITVAAGGRFSAGDMNTSGVSTADSFDGLSLAWNSNNSTAGMAFDLGTTSDLLTLSGAFTKGTGTDFIFNLEDAGGLTLGTYTLINFGSTDFSLGDFDFTSSVSGLNGNFILNAGNLQFQVTAVPEPSTYAMLGLGLGTLWLLRRKKQKA